MAAWRLLGCIFAVLLCWPDVAACFVAVRISRQRLAPICMPSVFMPARHPLPAACLSREHLLVLARYRLPALRFLPRCALCSMGGQVAGATTSGGVETFTFLLAE